MLIALYSLLLALALLVSAPWWLWRMATRGRYREGLAGRLGLLPAALDQVRRERVSAPGLLWLHAVSVGEVLALERLVVELRAALPGWLCVVSTTTATGQRVARTRLGVPVFYLPLDFAFAIRRYLAALRPSLFLTVESEFWPRMLVECERLGIPVAVVNARISDRSLPRYLRLRPLWQPLLAKIDLSLAQGTESAQRLQAIGVPERRIVITGNLKYDYAAAPVTNLSARLTALLRGRPVIVAGSTVAAVSGAGQGDEEDTVLAAMRSVWQSRPEVVLILAPRHLERCVAVKGKAAEFGVTAAMDVLRGVTVPRADRQMVLLDTLGDLAAVYALANVAFVGGSLVDRGGHNPLEAARYGVPVTMGWSYQNFREIVEGLRGLNAVAIVPPEPETIAATWLRLLRDDAGMGERARNFTALQAGATQRTVERLLELVRGPL